MKYHYIQVEIDSKHKTSYFTGSMLRGAMGYALKKVTCINPSYNCDGCFASSSCLFYQFYETKNSIHNYRFDIELGSGKFNFGLYLFNDACGNVAYVLSALEILLKKNGLGKENHTFEKIEMYLNGEIVYQDGVFSSLDIASKTFETKSSFKNLKIKLLTPLRIKKNNKFLRDDIDLKDILRSINQREQELLGHRAYSLNYEPSYTITVKVLSHKVLARNSNRQKTRMNMDGIVGEMAVLGIDKESHRLLKLGEVIGCGKQVVMGLGKIKIEEIV